MNRFFTLLLAASCLTAVGQVTYPYNPDGNADTLIGVTDLQDLLVVYGNTFVPSEIQVGDSSLSHWVGQVNQLLGQQQALIDSLIQSTNHLALGPTEHYKFHELEWTPQWNNGNNYLTTINFGKDGFIRLNGGNMDLTFIIVSDTALPTLFSNEQLGAENFGDTYWRDEYTQTTIPVNSDEMVVLFGNSGVVEEGTTVGEMNVYWTPIQNSDEEPAEDNLGPCQGEFTVNYQGYDYELVEIGDQCWFAENCRYLPEVSDMTTGSNTNPHAYVFGYDGYDLDEAKSTFMYENFGALYNLWAVTDWQLCPNGWVVTSRAHWQELESYLGYDNYAPTAFYPQFGNSTGLGIYFTGHRTIPGFGDFETDAYFWLSNWSEGFPDNYPAMRFSANQYFNEIVEIDRYGLGVRCIKDAE